MTQLFEDLLAGAQPVGVVVHQKNTRVNGSRGRIADRHE
jgi:hypothetical protein